MENGFQVTNSEFEGKKTSNLFCMVQNGPIVSLIVCIGLRWSSRWSLSSARAFSEALWTLGPKGLENALALLKDHLELHLRPIQTNKLTIGPFWKRQIFFWSFGLQT